MNPPSDPSAEFIIAAAILVNAVIVTLPPPSRHQNLVLAAETSGIRAGDIEEKHRGFLTSQGRFVDRREALELAYPQNQTFKKPIPHAVLTTEDLW